MMLRRLRNWFLGLVALLLILLATLSALVETQVGSRWVVKGIAALVKVDLGAMRGNLRRGMDIEYLDYRQKNSPNNNPNISKEDTEDGLVLRAEGLSFRWRPGDLIYGALMIDSFSARRLQLQLPVAAEEEQPEEAAPFSNWPSLRLPVRVQLRQLDVNNISYQQGDTMLQWQRLSGDLSLGTFNLRYRELSLIHSDYELRLNGRTSLDYPYNSAAELHWQWQQPAADDGTEGLVYRGVTRVDGSLLKLQLNNSLSSPVQATALVMGPLVNERRELDLQPALELTLEWPAQALPDAWWMADKIAPITRGLLKAEGNWQGYTASLEGAIQLPDAPALALNSQVAGNLEGLKLQTLSIRELGQRLTVIDSVSSAAASSDPALDAMVADAMLAEAMIATPSKVLTQTASSAAAKVAEEPSPNSAARLNISGDIAWSPQLQWQLAVEAQAFNLAGIIDNWPSNLNASFTTSGKLKESQWQLALRELELAGELRGVNVLGSGGVEFDGVAAGGATLRSDALSLIVGANQVQLKGEMGRDIDLSWNINAPLLQQIDESISGSVISKGDLRGDPRHPQIRVSASADEFTWGDYAVETLELSLAPENPLTALENKTGEDTPPAAVDITPGGLTSPLDLLSNELLAENYQLNFGVTNARLAQQVFKSITLKGSGSVSNHQLQAAVRSASLGRVDFGVKGQYQDYVWQGSFNQLALKLTKVPRWWLTSSKPIRFSGSGLVIGEQCLTTRTNLTAAVQRDSALNNEQMRGEWLPNASPVASGRYDWLVSQSPLPASRIEIYNPPRLCVSGDWSGRTGARLDALLDGVPLRQFLSLFKTEVYFAGVMDGSLALSSPDFSLTGTQANLNVTTRNAELRYQHPNGETDLYPWRDFSFRAQLRKGLLSATSGLEWLGYGRMDLNSELDLPQQKINQAQFSASFDNIAPLETLLPFTNDVKGELKADLALGGTFNAPYLVGDMKLHAGSANMTRLGLNLSGIELHIQSVRGGTINLISEMQSGDGRMTLVGDLKGFGTAQWTAEAFINGTNFRVVSLPQLKADLSPNIKVTADAASMNMTGEAVIPWARANIKSLPPSATRMSSDVIIVDEQFLREESATPFDVYSNLNLSLGDDVSFKGFGLSSKLTGRLNLLKEAHRPFFTNGYVSVSEGSYKAYGQTLTIERGRLAFQGPYDNPGLDIRATRQIRDADNTKVGLDIDGTLQRPKAKVFSSPSTSESQAMMMLLTGKPFKDASDADASLLLSALSGLGMDSGEGITADINRFFGVDQLEVKADDGIAQSQLLVGKYLTPRLLVRYIVGIFDRAFSFGFEYQLTDHVRIEAESGETNTVDVIYKIER